MNFRTLPLVILLLPLVTASCGERTPKQSPFEKQIKEVMDAKGDKLFRTPAKQADTSYTTAQYIKNGFPASAPPWTAEEFSAAHKALATLFGENPAVLPRFESDRSGSAFRSISDSSMLPRFSQKAVPLEKRFPECLQYYETSNGLTKVYIQPSVIALDAGRSTTEVYAAQLRICVVMIGLVGEFLPTLDPNDPSYPIRMGGLKKMKSGCVGIITSGAGFLRAPEFSAEAKLALSRHMLASLPGILPALDDDHRAAIRKALQLSLSAAESPELKSALRELTQSTGTSKADPWAD